MRFRNLMLATSIAGLALNASALTALGVVSCGSYIRNVEAKSDQANYAWMAGYLSGVATALSVDLVKGVDGSSIRLWTENYCRSNPLKNTADAADELAVELSKSLAKR